MNCYQRLTYPSNASKIEAKVSNIPNSEYLLLFLLPQCEQRHTRHLDNLECDTTNITLGLSLLTKPSNQDLYALANSPNQIPSFSSIKLRQPSLGTNEVTLQSTPQIKGSYFFPFLMT